MSPEQTDLVLSFSASACWLNGFVVPINCNLSNSNGGILVVQQAKVIALTTL